MTNIFLYSKTITAILFNKQKASYILGFNHSKMNVKEYGKVKFKKAAGIVNMYNLQHSKSCHEELLQHSHN